MLLIHQSIAKCRAWAKANDLNVMRLAEITGLSYSGLRDFWTDDWSPRPRTLAIVEAAIPPDFEWSPPDVARPEATPQEQPPADGMPSDGV